MKFTDLGGCPLHVHQVSGRQRLAGRPGRLAFVLQRLQDVVQPWSYGPLGLHRGSKQHRRAGLHVCGAAHNKRHEPVVYRTGDKYRFRLLIARPSGSLTVGSTARLHPKFKSRSSCATTMHWRAAMARHSVSSPDAGPPRKGQAMEEGVGVPACRLSGPSTFCRAVQCRQAWLPLSTRRWESNHSHPAGRPDNVTRAEANRRGQDTSPAPAAVGHLSVGTQWAPTYRKNPGRAAPSCAVSVPVTSTYVRYGGGYMSAPVGVKTTWTPSPLSPAAPTNRRVKLPYGRGGQQRGGATGCPAPELIQVRFKGTRVSLKVFVRTKLQTPGGEPRAVHQAKGAMSRGS